MSINNQKVLMREVKCSGWCFGCRKIVVWPSPRQRGHSRAGVAAILVRDDNRISERCKEVRALGLGCWLIC